MRCMISIPGALRRARPAWIIFGIGLLLFQDKPARGADASSILVEAAPLAVLGGELALALIGSIVAIGLIAAGLIWLGRHRARARFNAKLKDYRARAVDMMDRLDALKARLKALPIEGPTRSATMSGETLELRRKVESDLGSLWDRWLEVMDVVDRAQRRAAEKLAEADRLVSDAKVFDEVEAGAKACSEALGRLDRAGEEAKSTAEAVAGSREEAAAAVEKIGQAGLPTEPLQPELDRLAERETQAREVMPSDPIGAKTILDAALGDSKALGERAVALIARLEDAKSEREALETLRGEVAKQRAQGLRLDEEGGDPDPLLALTAEALDQSHASLEAGDPIEAAARIEEARGQAKAARGRLEAVIQAKALCARELPERRRESQRLREALRQYEAFEQELNRDFAADSWRSVSGNLTQARALLETFDRKADEAAEAASETSQKYLLGARLVVGLSREQQAVFRLMNAVGERLSALKAARSDAQRFATDFDDRLSRLRAFFDQNRQAIGAEARSSLDALVQVKEAAVRRASQPRPDWSSVQRDLAGALEEQAIVQTRAEADVKVHAQFMDELNQARREADRIGAFLASHAEDRAAANQSHRHAVEVLKRVGDERTRAGNEWAGLLEQVRGARADLNRAERLAHEDARLARQAETELSEAARTIRQARTFLSMGVTLDTTAAESLLDQATRLYHNQDYEGAIRSAETSIQWARQVHNQGAQAVYQRRMQLDADQRRRAAGLDGLGANVAANPIASPDGGQRVTDVSSHS